MQYERKVITNMTNRLEHRFSIKHVTRTSDEDYVKALRIYNDTTPYEIKTPTNEITYWLSNKKLVLHLKYMCLFYILMTK